MNIEIEHMPQMTIMTPVVRRLDASVAASFREQIANEMADAHHALIIDFSRVDFIDSSCLGTLVSLLKMMNGKGEMLVCDLKPGIRNMFTLTRMDRVFRICDDRAAACAELAR
ncbi:STAS domain-containing protein [Enterobacter sp. Bisph1]|uniref:STAS domain-containing protein n=1 Tax=Enterobacter sp. Bisph1 TaxID=1274399 RepID=UPI00057C1665|nr:STAS domain-containing protein [Enterobacter sp. Bisph1]